MREKVAIPNARPLDQLLTLLEKDPPLWRTHYQLISGYMDDASLADFSTNPPPLFGAERYLSETIKSQLQRVPHVTVVGLGELLGASFVAVAAHHRDDIQHGRLTMIATNKEPDFDIQIVLREANRRLNSQPLYQQVMRTRQIHSQLEETRRRIHATSCYHPLVTSSAELEFLSMHHPLVHYVSGVDTVDVPALVLEVTGQSTIHILHENWGGFTHHPHKNTALRSVTKPLHPQIGTVLTTCSLHTALAYQDAYQTLARAGYAPHKLPCRPPLVGNYFAYHQGNTF